MTGLTADEIASALIARVMREVQYFAASSTIQEGVSADEMWAHFLNHLASRKTLGHHE